MSERSVRTDLAVEARELAHERAGDTSDISGVEVREYSSEGCPVTHVKILDEQGSEALGKPPGAYVTVELAGLARHEPESFARAVRAVAAELLSLLPVDGQYGVLVAGLGNREITPDAVGPLCVDSVMVTRHLVDKMPEHFGHMRPVSAVVPGVLGTTGMETVEILSGIIGKTCPGVVIFVDALASRRLSRLCSTVQLSDTGIVPGSGVGNSRAAMNQKTLGLPVISMGVPTVVDAVTLMADLLEKTGQPDLDLDAVSKFSGGLMVTPKEIDTHVADISRVIGYAINLALHPGITVEDVTNFLA